VCYSPTAANSAATACTSRPTGSYTSTTSSASTNNGSSPPRTSPPERTCCCRPASTKPASNPKASRGGILSLYYGDHKVGEGHIQTQPGKFALGGEGLNAGRDGGAPVTSDYPGEAPWAFTGGTLHRVAVDVSGDPYIDLEREAVAMFARE